MTTRPPAPDPAPVDRAGADNMVQLVQLRWLAIAGQFATIMLVRFLLGVVLPMAAMMAVLCGLALLNIASMAGMRWRRRIANTELLAALLLDVLSLSAQLYLSGGATNPFVSLFLLQVVLGSVLLHRRAAWVIVAVTATAFALLTRFYRPIMLPPAFGDTLFELHVQGMWVCFALVAVLLVLFVSRINGNLRTRDAHLAELRRQAVEEDHIIRLGLLASGAAHELGTPLSSLSVILGDWRRHPLLAADRDLAAELDEMQSEVRRCKAIVTGILLAAGEARGEASTVTTVRGFFDGVVADWQDARGYTDLDYVDAFGPDVPIASDTVIRQAMFNVLDNAAEASSDWIGVRLLREGEAIVLRVTDRGFGFAPHMLAALGKPYQSTKGRGSGLGLFLVTNVMRKLGGSIAASNRVAGGAEIVLTLPLSALALAEDNDGR